MMQREYDVDAALVLCRGGVEVVSSKQTNQPTPHQRQTA